MQGRFARPFPHIPVLHGTRTSCTSRDIFQSQKIADAVRSYNVINGGLNSAVKFAVVAVAIVS